MLVLQKNLLKQIWVYLVFLEMYELYVSSPTTDPPIHLSLWAWAKLKVMKLSVTRHQLIKQRAEPVVSFLLSYKAQHNKHNKACPSQHHLEYQVTKISTSSDKTKSRACQLPPSPAQHI